MIILVQSSPEAQASLQPPICTVMGFNPFPIVLVALSDGVVMRLLVMTVHGLKQKVWHFPHTSPSTIIIMTMRRKTIILHIHKINTLKMENTLAKLEADWGHETLLFNLYGLL